MNKDKHKIEIYLSYSHLDEAIMTKIEAGLQPLVQQNLATIWHDGKINPGVDWEAETHKHLNTAEIILLLVSNTSLNSAFIQRFETPVAIDRYRKNEARIIPIIIDRCEWFDTPLRKLMALPKRGKPINEWEDREAAFISITEGVRKVVEELYKDVNGLDIAPFMEQLSREKEVVDAEHRIELTAEKIKSTEGNLTNTKEPEVEERVVMSDDQYREPNRAKHTNRKSASATHNITSRRDAPPNPWVSGSFYLVVFAAVIGLLLVVGKMLPLIALPTIIIGGILTLAVIGALQLRTVEQLSQENFLKLMGLSFQYLPFLRRRDNSANKSKK